MCLRHLRLHRLLVKVIPRVRVRVRVRVGVGVRVRARVRVRVRDKNSMTRKGVVFSFGFCFLSFMRQIPTAQCNSYP